LADFFEDRFGKSFAAADDLEANILAHEQFAFLNEELAKERHEEVEFVAWAFPVFAREAIESELGDAEAAAFFDGLADTLDAACMPLDPAEALSLSPATVAIHDDGDVPWHLGWRLGVHGSSGPAARHK
jgi:hypothetical protein